MWVAPKLETVPLGDRIAFVGPMVSGKTYCAYYLAAHYGFTKKALADKLKAIAYELYGTVNKDREGRKMYQELGDSLRAFDDDVFTKYLLNWIKEFHPSGKIVIDDVRLPREAELLRNNGFVLVGVNTPDSVREGRVYALYPDLAGGARTHPTEVSWGEIALDATVNSVTPADMIDLDRLIVGYGTD